MERRMFLVQRIEDKHDYGEEETRTRRKVVEQQGRWSGSPNVHFPYRRPKIWRDCRENYSLHPGKPHNRETNFVKAGAEENLEKAQFKFMVISKTLIHKTLVDSKLLPLRSCLRKKPKEASPRTVLSGFHRIYQTIRSNICWRQNCSSGRVKETSGRHTTLSTHQLDENAGQEQHILVGRDVNGHAKKNIVHAKHAWSLRWN